MHHALYDVGATVPLGHSAEALERKLFALRAEIDAILAQLGSEKVAAPGIETEPTPDMQSPEATTEVMELALDLSTPTQTEIIPEPSRSADEMVELTTAIPIDSVASDPPSAVVPTPQGAPEPQGNAVVASDDVAAIAAIEAAAAIADAPLLATEEAAAPQVEMSTAPASSPTALDEPIGATASERAAADVPAATTDSPQAPDTAQIIALEPRQRRQEIGSTVISASTRPRRRLATKIAASIVALLVAATLLVIVDKQAVGSALSLPWMSPLPSQVPSDASWPSPGDRQDAGRDARASRAGGMTDEALLSRYREAWPTGW
jgi:hypothetical protein